ncbi:MAG: glycosyltransferase family 4 protein, partial [Halobacteriales archaeon]|nr:glycosyltransferase family 4 protein [Halobacteriales archaeon]
DFKPMAGGKAEHAYRYAKYFHEQGHTVLTIAPDVEGCREFDEAQSFEIRRVKGRGTYAGLARFLAALVRALREEQFDWVYCPFWLPEGALAALTVPHTQSRLAIAVHGREVLYEKSSFEDRIRAQRQLLKAGLLQPPLQRWILRSADVVIAVSEWTRDAVLRAVPDGVDVRVVNNGVTPEEFEDATPLETVDGVDLTDRKVLLTVSRLAPRKGHDVVIQALPRITEEHPDTIYLVAGSGRERASLEALAERLGVEDHVLFLGYVPDPDLPDLYATADLFVMPNRWEGTSVEGFGIVFLEANATRTPVVGGDSGGVPDAVVDDVTGRLVDPYSVEAVAETITDLLSDRQSLARMGQNGYERVRSEFTWEHVGRELEEILRSFE